jgi:hypothetical protein
MATPTVASTSTGAPALPLLRAAQSRPGSRRATSDL